MIGGCDETPAVGTADVRRTLDETRRRLFWKTWLRVGAESLLFATVVVCAAWPLSVLTSAASHRAMLATVSLGVVAAFAFWRGWTAARPPSDRQVARFIEEQVPELDELLMSAVDCLRRPVASGWQEPLLAQAGARLATLDIDRVIPRSTLWRRAGECLGSLAMLGLVVFLARGPLLDSWDAWRMTVAPPTITFEVVPGDASAREGEALQVRARVLGLPDRVPVEPLRVLLESPEGPQELRMQPRDGWQNATLDVAQGAFEYRVAGYDRTSRRYRVDVRLRPRVERIDLHYQFPAFTGLPARVEENSGDVYAPAGTRVRVVVHTSIPVRGATLGLASGTAVVLEPASERTAEGALVVSKDDAYRITLTGADGAQAVDDTEYFVRIVADRPPDVRIVRPGTDRKVTRLEEVVVEAQADDDFGVDRLELVYAARGGQETVIRLGSPNGKTATGRHTLFVEELNVQPGDFVSYYARARDVSRGKRSTEVRSDIYFLEVRPFNEEFEAAQSSAMAGQGGAFNDLAERQKELIIATWKIDRRSVAGRSADDIRALAGAQGELKARAEQLANRMNPRNTQRRQGGPGLPGVAASPGEQPLIRAVEAMGRSQEALQALRAAAAVPHEMEALNQLLRAEAEVTRRQVAQQQAAGGRGGQTGNQDLSALFDQELQRQQQTKYENRQTTESTGAEDKSSDALDRLRALARRQEDIRRRQEELAQRRTQLAAAEVTRQLERLTREQEELRRQAEELATQMKNGEADQQQAAANGQPQAGRPPSGRPEGQQGQQAPSGRAEGQAGQNPSGSGAAVQAAAEAMGESAGRLSRDNLNEAARLAQRATDRLRQAEQALAQQQPADAARVAGELQLEARQLAEAERRLARDLRDQPAEGADALRRMAGQQERAADQARRLTAQSRAESSASAAASSSSSERPEPDGRSGTPTGQIEAQLRESARALRAMAQGQPDAGSESREAERAEAVARELDARAQQLAALAGRPAERSELSEQLARAGELRERVAELTRQLREDGGRAGSQGQRNGQPGESPGGSKEPDGRGQEAGGLAKGDATDPDTPSSSPGGQSPGAGGGSGTAEVARQLRELGRLADGLREGGDEVRRVMDSLEGLSPGRSAPGTEAWKQDFGRWESLRRALTLALEQFEARVSDRLQAVERENRLDSGASDAAPDAYQREVARYYRSLAKRPPS